jgi:hypothetical protein
MTENAKALRVALRPLADDIDDDVLSFLFDELSTTTTMSLIEDILLTFVPLFSDQTSDKRRAIAQKTQVLLRKELSECASASTVVEKSTNSNNKNVSNSSSQLVERVVEDRKSDSLSETEILILSVKSSDIIQLQALFPDVNEEHLKFALASTGGASSSIEKAASFLLENDIETLIFHMKKDIDQRHSIKIAEAKAIRAKEEQAKVSALARYDEQIDDKDKRYRPTLPPEMLVTLPKGAKVIKYLDGKPIHMKPSEKFVIEKDEREDLLASSLPQTTLKIKKKGQGGASPGFKK